MFAFQNKICEQWTKKFQDFQTDRKQTENNDEEEKIYIKSNDILFVRYISIRTVVIINNPMGSAVLFCAVLCSMCLHVLCVATPEN